MASKAVVLITGCSAGGIGFALCNEFAPVSRTVYATARRLESMQGLDHPNIKKLQMDVCNDASVSEGVKKIIEAEGRIDIVVSNAGIVAYGPIMGTSLQESHNLFDTNYFGMQRLAQAAIPHMLARRSGKFIVVGSIEGLISGAWQAHYAASKAATRAFCEVLTLESAPFGVQVQHVAAGAIRTGLYKNQEIEVRLPEGSLYEAFRPSMTKRLEMSIEGQAPLEAAVRVMVREAMKEKLRFTLYVGGFTSRVRALLWLPRTWALWILWKIMSA